MAERDLTSTGGDGAGDGGGAKDDWDAAFSRLLEGVNLDEISVPTALGRDSARFTFGSVRQRVADQLREKLRSERLRREAIERLQRQFDACSTVVEQALPRFVHELLDSFNGGGAVRRLPDPKDARSRSWQVLAYRSPGKQDQREPIVTVLLTMRGMDALDRGQPALECRVSTPRNPRLVDFTAATEFEADLEDGLCRAYQDILGTLRFEPSPDAGVA